jgi:hypothetical protein
MRILLIVLSVVLGLVAGRALAQSSATLSVTARVIAPCTVTSGNPRSSCSELTLARQSNVINASARISTSNTEAVVTHKGGVPPRIARQGDRISVGF